MYKKYTHQKDTALMNLYVLKTQSDNMERKKLARNTMINTINTIVLKYTEDFNKCSQHFSNIPTDELDEININIY